MVNLIIICITIIIIVALITNTIITYLEKKNAVKTAVDMFGGKNENQDK